MIKIKRLAFVSCLIVYFFCFFSFISFAAVGKTESNISLPDDAQKPSLPVDPKIIQLPAKPNPPVLNPVLSPTNQTTQIISGTKDKNTSIWLNGQLIVASDSLSTWSYNLTLIEGNNPISLTSKNKWDKESDPVILSIFLDTQSPAITITSPHDGQWVGKD